MKKLSISLSLVIAIVFVGCKKKDVPTSVDFNGTTLYFTSGKIGEKTPWCAQYSVTGGTSATNGEANTDTIVAALTLAGDTTQYPAKKCKDLVEGGFEDWYLPSIEEFKAIAAVQDDLPGDYTGTYWTSTELSSSSAEFYYIHYGSQYNTFKSYEYDCLCVRKD